MTTDDDLRRPRTEAGQGLIETLDPTDGSALAQILAIEDQAALAARSEPAGRGHARLTGNAIVDDDGASARSEPRAEGLREALARAFSQGYRAGLANEVDDWNASDEAVAEYGRRYAARADTAILAATSPAEGLDVERLRDAIAETVDATTAQRLLPYLDIIAMAYNADLTPEQPDRAEQLQRIVDATPDGWQQAPEQPE